MSDLPIPEPVKVNIFAIKDESGREGMVEIIVPFPEDWYPDTPEWRSERESFSDGVAAGVAALMQHFQPNDVKTVD